MELVREYLTDPQGKVSGVILDYAVFKKMEEALIDQGLLEAIEEARGDETMTLEEFLSEMESHDRPSD